MNPHNPVLTSLENIFQRSCEVKHARKESAESLLSAQNICKTFELSHLFFISAGLIKPFLVYFLIPLLTAVYTQTAVDKIRK